MNNYPRDLVGYGENPPHPKWPNNARIALQIVVNYEEGGESCILHGDQACEAFLSEIVGAPVIKGARHMNMESIYEYGSRAGFWRIYRLMTKRNIPITVFGVATALQKNPKVVAAMQKANWEIASHGLKWIDYQHIGRDLERQHMQEAMMIHEQVTGSKPKGWYTGRSSPNTSKLVLEQEGLLYDSDSYADDLPYWVDGASDTPHLVVPYTLDNNDMRFVTHQGFNSGEQFFTYLKDSFDALYAEGRVCPKMMSVGLHCRLVGRPGRIVGLQRFLDHVANYDDVWICRRVDIAKHWWKHHQPAK